MLSLASALSKLNLTLTSVVTTMESVIKKSCGNLAINLWLAEELKKLLLSNGYTDVQVSYYLFHYFFVACKFATFCLRYLAKNEHSPVLKSYITTSTKLTFESLTSFNPQVFSLTGISKSHQSAEKINKQLTVKDVIFRQCY